MEFGNMKEAIRLLKEAIAYEGDYAYDFICKKINQVIALLCKEQPAASDKERVELNESTNKKHKHRKI